MINFVLDIFLVILYKHNSTICIFPWLFSVLCLSPVQNFMISFHYALPVAEEVVAGIKMSANMGKQGGNILWLPADLLSKGIYYRPPIFTQKCESKLYTKFLWAIKGLILLSLKYSWESSFMLNYCWMKVYKSLKCLCSNLINKYVAGSKWRWSSSRGLFCLPWAARPKCYI